MKDLNRERMLREVMAADFTVIDLHLYLDTHPCDRNAITLFNNAVQRSKMIRENFERMYGPINANLTCSGFPWRWIESPWPWERQDC